jgi:integrase
MTYLRKHPKTGVWYYRRGVPADLRPFLDNRHDWNESLRTKSYEEAKQRSLAVASNVSALFAQAQDRLNAQQTGKPPAAGIDVQTAARLVQGWKEAELHRRASALLADPFGGADAFDSECGLLATCGHAEALTVDQAGIQWLDRHGRAVGFKVRDITRGAGLLIGEDHPAHTILWHAVRDAWVAVLEQERRWRALDYSNLPTAAPAAPTVASAPVAAPAATGLRLGEVYERYAAERGITAKLKLEHATLMRRLTGELGGDVPIRSVTKAQVVLFKDLMIQMPTVLTAAQRRMPMRDIIAEFAGRDVARAARGTVIKNISFLHTFFTWAVDNGYADSNPVSGVIPAKQAGPARDKRQPYSAEDIRTIFTSDIWTDPNQPRDERYWLPVLALHTGCRLEELGQLARADVRQQDGVWFLDITTQSDDDGHDKRLKTDSSHRRVPLHPTLIRLGFPAYAGGAKGSRLFPNLKADRTGKLTAAFSKWWARHCDRIGLTDRRKVFHSFRHAFKDARRDAGLSEEIHDALTGHSGGVGRRYGNGVALPRLAQEIARVGYPSFPL